MEGTKVVAISKRNSALASAMNEFAELAIWPNIKSCPRVYLQLCSWKVTLLWRMISELNSFFGHKQLSIPEDIMVKLIAVLEDLIVQAELLKRCLDSYTNWETYEKEMPHGLTPLEGLLDKQHSKLISMLVQV